MSTNSNGIFCTRQHPQKNQQHHTAFAQVIQIDFRSCHGHSERIPAMSIKDDKSDFSNIIIPSKEGK